MPLIDLIFAEGSLSQRAQEDLTTSLWATAIEYEGIEKTAATESVAWVYLDERPRHRIGVGSALMSQNIYRINVRVMVGFMDQERINGMAAALTKAVLAADGTEGDGNPRVFCIVEEIPSGTWSIDGKVWTSVFAAETLGLEQRRIDEMKRVIGSRPRLDVPLLVEA